MDAIREVKYLQELAHPNIIALHDVFSSKDQNLNLVLEYLPLGDLEQLIRDWGVSYGTADVKAWMAMLLRGVWFCHERFVLHRDIKPNNLLIAADGEVKLADFGLARAFGDPYYNMTSQVITRWYRPLELLYGARSYSAAVDLWSAGMVFAELLHRTPFCPGHTDVDQIAKICAALGTPTEAVWPGVTSLPYYMASEQGAGAAPTPVQGRDYFHKTFQTAGPVGADLLAAMLKLDPRQRITARQALQHPWWATEPRPTPKEQLPRKSAGKDGGRKVGEDMGMRPGEVGAAAARPGDVDADADADADEDGQFKNVARRLDFGAAA
ncbi:TFIIH complex serine/threonine-protein kinase subunit kin28 [Ascosphaera acerosa]|nr:TFIIH complex serine/threonine-protein kinase subunit kin28 [Ascosphaera acerosa]